MKSRASAFVLILALLSGLAPAPVLAQEDGSPVIRYQLKAPILFTQGSTGGNTGGGDTGGGDTGGGDTGGGDGGEGPPDGQPNDNSLTLSTSPGIWRANDAISFHLDISGGNGSYTVVSSLPGLGYADGWVAGDLPAGSAPTYATSFDLSANDTAGIIGGGTYQITVYPELSVTTPASQQLIVGQSANLAPVATGVVSPSPVWTQVGTDVTSYGLSFDPATGAVTGSPSAPVTINGIVVRVTDPIDSRPAITGSMTLQYVAAPINVQVDDLTVRLPASIALPATVSGGFQPPVLAKTISLQNSVNGQAVAGLTYDQGTSTIVGSLPVGTYNGVLAASNTYGSGQDAFQIQVKPAFAVSFPSNAYNGTTDVPFTSVTPSVNGSDTTRTWSYAPGSGTLPAGMTFSTSNGTISGTPTAGGTFSNIQLTATDAEGTATTQAITVTIAQTEIVKTITTNKSTGVNIGTLFNSAEWTSTAPKRVIVNSGVVVYSTSINTPAMRSSTGWNGTLIIENRGFIYGAGASGSASYGVQGTKGGTAFLAEATGIKFYNTGTIMGGGGGGGKGGKGGDGKSGGGAGYNGGAGGNGGNGASYGIAATAGTSGSAGGTFAGAGGKGGNGGGLGSSGASGSPGTSTSFGGSISPSGGGQVGSVVQNPAYVTTWVNTGAAGGTDIPVAAP